MKHAPKVRSIPIRRRIADLFGGYEPRRRRAAVLSPDVLTLSTRRRTAAEKRERKAAEQALRDARAARDPSRGEAAWRRAPKLTDQGFTGAGGGLMGVIDSPPEFRGTTVQACGLNPFVVGNTYPIVGTPLGRAADGTAFHYDPISATYRSRRQATPSVFVLGLPSFGKSTVGRKIGSGAIAQGQILFVFADTKPDFTKMVQIIGGDRAMIVRLGHGQGYLNPLGIGSLGSIIPLLDGFPQVQTQVAKQVHQRRRRIVTALCEIERGTPLEQPERNVLSAALRILEAQETAESVPLLSDLIALIEQGPPELMRKVYTQDQTRYRDKVESLLETLAALLDGDLGEVFSGPTTTPVDFTGEQPPVAVVVDISALSQGDSKLEAAVMAACWEDGFGAIEAAHVLADCGLRPQRHFVAVLDEFWRVLAGPGMVARVDALTRLTRTVGTALVMITHTVKDLEALEAEVDVAKAKGFIERAGAVIVGALPRAEMDKLDDVIPFTADDKAWVAALATPGAYDPILGKPAPPAGRGHFLLKQGTERVPGQRFTTVLTPTELRYGWHDTDTRFAPTKEPS